MKPRTKAGIAAALIATTAGVSLWLLPPATVVSEPRRTFAVALPADQPREFFKVRARGFSGLYGDWASTGPGSATEASPPPGSATGASPPPGHVLLAWEYPVAQVTNVAAFEVWASPDLRGWTLRTNLAP